MQQTWNQSKPDHIRSIWKNHPQIMEQSLCFQRKIKNKSVSKRYLGEWQNFNKKWKSPKNVASFKLKTWEVETLFYGSVVCFTKKKFLYRKSPIFFGFWCFFCTCVNPASIWVCGWVGAPPKDNESHPPDDDESHPHNDDESHPQDHPQP